MPALTARAVLPGARAPVGHFGGVAGGVGHGTVAAAGYYHGGAFGRGYRGYGNWGGRWGGGYWGGRFWPGVFYGAGFAWFLPALPLYYSTYWWDGVPYYYYNDAYYTWSPTADGYVATDPPPAASSSAPNPADGSGPNDGGAAAYPDNAASDASAAPQPIPPGAFVSGGGRDNVFAYPANGQTTDQQAADRLQCDQWAASQTNGTTASPEYHRAVIACFQGRGYSAQ